ncbi:uncharacterized conserved protein [Microbacterium testaceum StLB037]|uniref:Uncharacterized conserved protein n=1 Tax=Microbacterium testaceum (strain StLB037) TaxID=979556 RepID=E8NAQ7_MICTS|nr:YdcF family protein [Microbacterium testaceum]BAJ75924.1 uncharacterized conserved protein [Microbacterium testaceum StLB037]
MLLLAFAALLLVVFAVARARQRAQLREGTLLVAAVVFAALGVLQLLVQSDPDAAATTVRVVAVATPVIVLVLAVFLITNGITMLRLEGRSLANLLSLIAGVGLLVFPLLLLALLAWGGFGGFVVAAGVVLVAGYAAAAFVAFLVSSLLYAALPAPRRPRAIVVLGSGLIRGEVPPLLRGRLDRAIAAWRRAVRAGGAAPVLVPSGGQGPDEPRPEGEAMAEYLRDQGIPGDLIRPETRSLNTRENLEFSRVIVDGIDGGGPVLIVTSDYHMLRAGLLARRRIPRARVVGARTAAYFVPSAFLREYVALLARQRWMHVVFALVFGATLVSVYAAIFLV